MMEPLYAMHKDENGAILGAASFGYSFEISKWLQSLDIRAGDKIEFGAAAKRELPKPLSVVA